MEMWTGRTGRTFYVKDAGVDGTFHAGDDVERLHQAGGHEAPGGHEADERVLARGQDREGPGNTGRFVGFEWKLERGFERLDYLSNENASFSEAGNGEIS